MGLYSWKDKGQMEVRAITQIQQMSPSLPGDDGNESKSFLALPAVKAFCGRRTPQYSD